MGIRDRLSRLLTEAPANAEAIEYEGDWWTWGQIQDTARDVVEALDALGLPAGGRVGVVLENRPEHVAVVAAVIASGRCVVMLSPLQPPLVSPPTSRAAHRPSSSPAQKSSPARAC